MILKVNKSILSGNITIPGSKSHTIRAVVVASLAEGTSYLRNYLLSSDTNSCIDGVRLLGATVDITPEYIKIIGIGGIPQKENIKIDVGNSGTSLRILTGICSVSDKVYAFDGDSSIRKRPMKPLFSALEKLGAKSISTDGKCPFTIQGPIKGGKTEVDGISSQFTTALLFACPLASDDTEITVHDLHERPYVEITLDWLRRQGIQFEQKGLEWFRIKGNQRYKSYDAPIPADFSSAAFPLVAAAITGSEITIKGLDFNDYQGDKAIFTYLENMGLKMEKTSDGVKTRKSELTGIDIDMNATPDALPAMAVAGCFAKGTTRLLNVPQARLKECDRIKAACTELKKMGADIEELKDGLIIHHSPLKGAKVHGYDDHRMVMSLACAAMAMDEEVKVDTAEAISVTYPSFIKDMMALGANIKEQK